MLLLYLFANPIRKYLTIATIIALIHHPQKINHMIFFCASSRNCLTTVIWEKPKIICIRLLEIFAGIPIKKSEKVC